MSQAYPLHWPESQERTKSYALKASRFRTELKTAVNNVTKSIAGFTKDSGKKVERIVISSNVTLLDDSPEDAGVAVYFNWDGLDCCIAVDQYRTVKENVQAIVHVIEAERTKLRHGGLNVVRAAFRGYAALPPPSNGKDWREVLGLSITSTLGETKTQYRKLANLHHPDKAGGSQERFTEIQRAWKQAQEHFNNE